MLAEELVGLFHAILVCLIGGLLLKYITKRHRLKALILSIVAVVWQVINTLSPRLVTVPDVKGEYKDLAAYICERSYLKPELRNGTWSGEVEANKVQNQIPNPGILVDRKSRRVIIVTSLGPPVNVVPFSVSVQAGAPSSVTGTATASLNQPKSGEKVHCARGADGIYRFSVRGTSSGPTPGRFSLLLWLRPENPSSQPFGWYLERPPVNGVTSIERDGSWLGFAQLGNPECGPPEGAVVDVAVSVVDASAANQLTGQPGIVVRDQPVGFSADTASGVVLTLK